MSGFRRDSHRNRRHDHSRSVVLIRGASDFEHLDIEAVDLDHLITPVHVTNALATKNLMRVYNPLVNSTHASRARVPHAFGRERRKRNFVEREVRDDPTGIIASISNLRPVGECGAALPPYTRRRFARGSGPRPSICLWRNR